MTNFDGLTSPNYVPNLRRHVTARLPLLGGEEGPGNRIKISN